MKFQFHTYLGNVFTHFPSFSIIRIITYDLFVSFDYTQLGKYSVGDI